MMQHISPWIILTVALLTKGCTFPSAADDPELVSNLRCSPSAFDSFTRNTEIRYTLKAAARVSINIVKRDSAGKELLVRTIITDLHETKGSHTHTWLGDTESGFFAPSGLYIVQVRAGSRRFETAVRVFHF